MATGLWRSDLGRLRRYSMLSGAWQFSSPTYVGTSPTGLFFQESAWLATALTSQNLPVCGHVWCARGIMLKDLFLLSAPNFSWLIAGQGLPSSNTCVRQPGACSSAGGGYHVRSSWAFLQGGCMAHNCSNVASHGRLLATRAPSPLPVNLATACTESFANEHGYSMRGNMLKNPFYCVLQVSCRNLVLPRLLRVQCINNIVFVVWISN